MAEDRSTRTGDKVDDRTQAISQAEAPQPIYHPGNPVPFIIEPPIQPRNK